MPVQIESRDVKGADLFVRVRENIFPRSPHHHFVFSLSCITRMYHVYCVSLDRVAPTRGVPLLPQPHTTMVFSVKADYSSVQGRRKHIKSKRKSQRALEAAATISNHVQPHMTNSAVIAACSRRLHCALPAMASAGVLSARRDMQPSVTDDGTDVVTSKCGTTAFHTLRSPNLHRPMSVAFSDSHGGAQNSVRAATTSVSLLVSLFAQFC